MQANQNWIMLTVFALISSVIISTGAYADTSNIALGASYTLTPAPDTAYPDSGGELTDGAFGDPANPYDPAWMAWGFYEPTIILDLGESRTLAGITVHCLNDPLWGIILPSIVVSYSADGETYATIGPMQQAAGTLTLPTSATTRYIRFAVDRDQWAFIDEIEVFSETEPVPVETIPLMAIVPASQDAAPGDTVTAGIMLDDVENLYSFEFQLSYDPAILMFGSMTPGTLLGSDGHPITCLGPSQLGPGTVMYSCIRELFPPFSGVSGSGLLATAHFTAIGDGTSPLALTGVTLANASNIMQSMAHGTEDGAVTVTTPPAPGQLTERRILLIVTATDPDKEEYSRFLNLMDGLGYAYDIIEDVEIAQTDLPSHPLVILYGDSLEFLEISAQAEDGIIGAIQAGTNVLWIGNGITGSQTSAALADAFGITYGSHDPASVLGADKVLYRDIDGNLDVFPIYDEYVIAVCPKAGTQVLAGFIDQDADLILPAVTRNQEDVDAGQAVYVALDAFSYWKSENEPFTWGRAELITKLIWQLQGSGMAGIHPFPGAYDAASIVRVEDISPSGEAMGQTDPEWVARFQRMVDLYDQAGQPLSIGTIPVYEDPYNEEHHPWASTQNNIPALKAVVEDAVADGACLIVHGYDHQDGTGEDDVSGVDWEVWDEDSDTWMSYTEQLQVTSQGRNEIAANFAYDSKTWETPHYKGNHDTYAAAAAAGFSYFSESDTKIWPNRFGYLNVADGSLISIPETAFDFPEFGTVEEWQTYARKQEDGILARMLRMDGIFFYFIHNHNDYQLDAAQQLLDALEGKQVWKTTVEEMGDWWSTREHISIETAADPAGSRIVATVAYQGGAGTAGYPPDDVTVAFRLPDGASFVGATVDSQPATRTRTVTKAGIAFAFVMFSLPDDGTPVEVQASYAQQASSGSFADLVPGCAWTGCSASCDAALYDEDRDLIPNGKDRCPGTAAGAIAGSEGCTGSEGSIEPPPSTIPDCSNVALGLPYTLSPAPTAPYVDDGTKLTDGLYGSDVPSDGRWVGWGYDEPRIDIDLGSAQPIRQLRFSSLSNPIWGINLPLITASYSLDGISYSVLSGSFTDGEDDLVYDFSETQMRYVRFTVVRNVWAFVDEIEVCDTSDGGGDPDPDSDGDAVTDSDDQCPGTPAGTPVDDDGCPVRTDGGDLIPTKITWNNNLANYTDSVTGWAANVGDSCTWAPVPLRIDFFAPHGVLEETFYATISPWLQPGDERGSQVFFSPDWCGEYTVRLTVDYGDIFSELDETNNMAEYPWLVEGPTCACPDEDGDGVCDDDDLCPGTPENEVANPEEGCSCSQYDWDDGNECTYDWCEDGDEYHDPLDGESCGEHVSCPADHCEGMTFIDWSAGGYGVCEEDSCNPYHCAFTAHPDDVRCGWCPDEDDDGVCDDDDLCPGTPAGEPVNDDGCS
ncbi:DUF2334 domain-containing protein, partial [Candidatus Woesearchaeota archaeon]|nr:DUF2334 domain-containing protein [Candidatus Woesearchaeota archaeon]